MLDDIYPYFLILFALLIIGESIYSIVLNKELFQTSDSLTSISLGIFGVFTKLALKGINLMFWFFLYDLSPLSIETSFWSLLILFFLNEFIYYWFHRISHEVRLFWATHVNHHSSLKFNFATATRTPFLNSFYHILFWIPLPLLGFHPMDILFIEMVSFMIAFVQHTTLIPKLGIFELLLNTPSHHRVHHSSNPKYINKNYGNTLIIFDKLFGTFQEELENVKPIYGLTKNPEDRSILNIIFHYWKDIIKNGNLFGKA